MLSFAKLLAQYDIMRAQLYSIQPERCKMCSNEYNNGILKIAISGPSGIGKTSLANAIAYTNQFRVIHGDDYILENSDRALELIRELKTTKSFIFEHVSAYDMCIRFNIQIDVCYLICCDSSKVISKQEHTIKSTIKCNSAQEALRKYLILAKHQPP